MRAAARHYHCAASTVCFWVQRARGRRLDRVDWADRPSGSARPANRTARSLERRIVALRRWLQWHDALGYIGAEAIRHVLLAEGRSAPSVRTIGRILRRRGVLPQKRRRYPPPPPGWYLPEVCAGRAELDQLDVVEGLQLRGQGPVEVLNAISLWGKLVLAEPATAGWRVQTITAVLRAHWRRWGRPVYLQMDNDTRFAGSTRAVRRLGRLICFCLAEGVVPVFAPPRETGFQAAIESFNGLWQAKLWQRFHHRHLRSLRLHSRAFVSAHRARYARDAMPRHFGPAHPAHHIVFLRRTDARGRIWLLGAPFTVAPHWSHRLVRASLNVSTQTLRCHALRRRDPSHQPCLKSSPFPLFSPATF